MMGSMFGKEAAETGVKARNNNVAVKNKITEKVNEYI